MAIVNGTTGNDFIHVAGDGLTPGADHFIYTALADSTVANSDLIVGFSHLEHDKIDLKAIDADSGAAGNQAFSFIGCAAFSNHAGELNYARSGGHTFITGDTEGNGTADFRIDLLEKLNMHAGDFIL